MKVSHLTQSKYLKHQDLDGPKLLTVRGIKLENVAFKGEPEEKKGVMYFEELDKGLVLNKTNLKLAEKVFDSDDTDDWIGRQIVLYVRDDIEYAGEIVSGLRLRASRMKQQEEPRRVKDKPSGTAFDEMDSDVPF